MRVKGTAILDLIKIIRSEKNRDWDQYLEPEDMDIVKSIISATQWYPGDSFWRISYAVTKEIAEMKYENVLLFGRISAQSYLKVYKRILVEGDPIASLEQCVNLWQMFYDFEGAHFKKSEIEKGTDWVKIKAYNYPDVLIPEMREHYFIGLAGYFQEIAEKALGKDIKLQIEDKVDFYELTFSWA